MITTAELLANEIERRARGDIADGSPDDLTEAMTRWAAILRMSVATTPGDRDRGRELLRSIVDVFTDQTGAFQFEIVERPGDPQSPSRCVSLTDAVRALAEEQR